MSNQRKALIGIITNQGSGTVKVGATYANSVIGSGGIPVCLPYTDDKEKLAKYGEIVDGMIFTGGVDVNPARYGEEVLNDTVSFDDERDAFEFAVFEAFFKTGKPILGICRGCQFVNVALGGTLYQDIENHRSFKDMPATRHNATVLEGSILAEVLGAGEINVNSYHHQAVKVPAPGAKIIVKAYDGTNESYEYTDENHKYVLGIQWHPEKIYESDENSRKIFDHFIKVCEEYIK